MPGSNREDFAVYAKTKIAPVLQQMVENLLVERPVEPVPFMCEWLKSNASSLDSEIVDAHIQHAKEGGEGFSDDVSKLLAKLDEVNTENGALKSVGRTEVARLKAARDSEKEEKEAAQKEVADLSQKLNDTNQQVTDLTQSVEAKEKELQTIAEEMKSLKEALEAAQSAAAEPKAAVPDEGPRVEKVLDSVDSAAFKEAILLSFEESGVKVASADDYAALGTRLLNILNRNFVAYVIGAEGRGALISKAAEAASTAGCAVKLHSVLIESADTAFVNGDDEGNTTDGVFTTALKEAVAAAGDGVQLVHLEGDNDMILLEHMSTSVFNQRTIELWNGETVEVPQNVRFVVETDEAENVPVNVAEYGVEIGAQESDE